MSIYYVYAYLREHSSPNWEAGTPYYIGKGKAERSQEVHYNTAGKRPKDKRFIIKIFENCSESEALALECGLIKIFGRIDIKTGCLRNKTNGGEGVSGLVHSEETKQKLSDSKIGRKNPMFGKTHSDEYKDKLRVNFTGENNPNFGKHLSEETRKKISVSKKAFYIQKKFNEQMTSQVVSSQD